jgi:cyanophycin synthetase
VRRIEIRLLDGPNLYRLEPAVKLEVAIGRRRTWYGRREPDRYALVRLGANVPPTDRPRPIATLAAWAARLRGRRPEAPGPVTVHRSSDPGHWIVAWPWARDDRARAIADGALALAERGLQPVPRRRMTPAQRRLEDSVRERVAAAGGSPPAWIRDADRRVPVISISGTNGKSTTTRLIAHILRETGRHVGTTTSDGVLVDGSLVSAGDWTGPAGAAAILGRDDVDVAVLETARGGILLRGIGYESNEASVITNVSSDHLDLQGVHTLPELAEVKATISRITRPDGWVILNADDRHVAALAPRLRARVALFSLEGDGSPRLRRHLGRGGRAYLVRGGALGEQEGAAWQPIVGLDEIPIAFGGAARHNVANALAAAGGARAMGASLAEVRAGLRSFAPSAADSPGRLNLFRDGPRLLIVDFAHNEAGIEALLDVAEALARAGDGPAAPVTAVIGTAGDRPDDTLRGLGRIAAGRVQRLAIKETLAYLRGRPRASVIGEIRAGAVDAGWREEIPVYESEPAALAAELDHAMAIGGPRILVLLCHQDREAVFGLLADRGLRPVTDPGELRALLTGPLGSSS